MTDTNSPNQTIRSSPGEDPYRTQIVSTGLPDYSGRILGNCRLLGLLGVGGMSLVYRARHLALDVDRVVKILRPGLNDYDNAKKRLVREARLVARLDHPYIAKVYNAGEQEGLAFIEMELVQGRTLRSMLSSKGRLPLLQALTITGQMAQALAYAHGFSDAEIPSGIAHRDVKPENIIVLDNMRVKLMDFGIAKPVEGTTDTLPGSVVGTYAYMSPEQIEGDAIDFRTDIYSLAVVCYEMLAGHLPYEGTTITKLAMEISAGRIRPLNLPEVPAAIRKTLEKALARMPGERFASALLFMAALESAAAAQRGAGRRRWLAGGLAGLALIGAFAFGFFFRTPVGPSPQKATEPPKKQAPVPPAAPVAAPSVSSARTKVAPSSVTHETRTSPKPRLVERSRPAAVVTQTGPKGESQQSALALGRRYEQEHNWTAAVAEFLKVQPPSAGGIEAQYVEARLRVAKIRMNALAQGDQALAELEQLYHFFKYMEVGDLLGQCYLRNRSYSSAEKALRVAMRPDSKILMGGRIRLDVLLHLGMALEGRILADNDKSVLPQALQVWQDLREKACDQGESSYCEQAQKHLARLSSQ